MAYYVQDVYAEVEYTLKLYVIKNCNVLISQMYCSMLSWGYFINWNFMHIAMEQYVKSGRKDMLTIHCNVYMNVYTLESMLIQIKLR